MAKAPTTLNLFELSRDDALAMLEAKYGRNTVVLASRAKAIKTTSRVPTGSVALDIALGGGWTEGRIHEAHGLYSSYKSTIGQLSIAAFQRKYPDGEGVYIDLERTFSAAYAESLGVDLDRLWLVNPDCGEQAVDVSKDIVSLPSPLFVVLDSLAAMSSATEIEASADQGQMAINARLINRFMRVIVARMRNDMYDTDSPKVTLLVLNQIRHKVGVMFGSPEITPGGQGKDFAYSTSVRFGARRSAAKFVKVTKNGVSRQIQISETIAFSVSKNKCGGPPRPTGEFTFYLRDFEGKKANACDNISALIEYGLFTGVIQQTEKILTYGDLTGKLKDFTRKLQLAKPVIRNRLKTEILSAYRNPDFINHLEDSTVKVVEGSNED